MSAEDFSQDGSSVIKEVLRLAEPRPIATGTQPEKNAYAVRFADAMAASIARDLGEKLPGATASPKRSAGSVRGAKQLDVNVSTPASGLVLGVSLKSVHIREATGAMRYTHNLKRNEEELRIEASGYHKRQPYAVMVGVLFLPFDSCTDGKKANPSSFGSWVRHLRPYAGRGGPHDDVDRFERIFIGLYEPDGTELRFFDVESDPPKNDRPPLSSVPKARQRHALSYAEFLATTYRDCLRRNKAEFRWADGSEEPLEVDNEVGPSDE